MQIWKKLALLEEKLIQSIGLGEGESKTYTREVSNWNDWNSWTYIFLAIVYQIVYSYKAWRFLTFNLGVAIVYTPEYVAK